jgi:hypothetical protein
MSTLSMSHPLADVLYNAALGAFPDPDGTIDVVPAPPGPVDAVVAFTAHTIVAADVSHAEVNAHLDVSDLGAPLKAPFLYWLGRRLGAEPGSLDAMFAALGTDDAGDVKLVPRNGRREHPRAARAARYRTDVRVFTDPGDRAVVVLGRGLAGRWEVGFEVQALHRNAGMGRKIVAATRSLVEPGEPVFMQVAPGNAASIRAVSAGGYVPLGAEVLFARR